MLSAHACFLWGGSSGTNYTGCFKIREFRIQSMVGKDPVELEKYLKKKSLFLKKL
jgi:hypothetical protein